MNLSKLGLLLAVCFGVSGCAHCKRTAFASAPLELLRFTASVDGSGRVMFTRDSVRYEHKFWSPPWNVTLNGESWTNFNQTPTGWAALAGQLDLTRARIVQRSGRDVIALEPTTNGFDLYLSDTPNGAADYEATIAIPRRK